MMDHEDRPPIIQLSHVHHAYGRYQALIDLSFEILKNELAFICGPSGAGKTTLLRLLYAEARPASGEIAIDGTRLDDIPRNGLPLLRRKFGVIFQDYKLIPGRSVFENVALVLEAAGHRRASISKKVLNVLRLVGMDQHAGTLPIRLSGGEQQRVAVARAVVGDPKIILADEPTGNLDEASAQVVMDLLQAAYIRGATVLIATHDKAFIHRLGGRILHLKLGRLAAFERIEKYHDRTAL
jgi:cell division transport system ATP-binding protein